MSWRVAALALVMAACVDRDVNVRLRYGVELEASERWRGGGGPANTIGARRDDKPKPGQR